MKFSVYQISRQGGRERNEDRMGYAYTRESGLFVLADGMGGHPEGAMAAQLALQTGQALVFTAALGAQAGGNGVFAHIEATAHLAAGRRGPFGRRVGGHQPLAGWPLEWRGFLQQGLEPAA